MPGMHGHYTAVTALQKADLLVVDRRALRRPRHRQPGHRSRRTRRSSTSTSTRRRSGRTARADVPIVGDAKDVTRRDGPRAREGAGGAAASPDRSPWLATLQRLAASGSRCATRRRTAGRSSRSSSSTASYEATHGDATIVSGVGQHQMWASQHYKFTRPRQWINSGGLGTMGFAVPAALGAKVGAAGPARSWPIDGDGCFQMTAQELATSTTENIPIVVAILNNGYLGHGPPVAGAVLRRALLAGAPDPGRARLREARRGVRRGRHARRDAGRRRRRCWTRRCRSPTGAS